MAPGWKVQSSPDEGGSTALNSLSGVAATSSSNAWAVGSYSNGTRSQTLIEHRNSTAWTIQTSPDPGGSTNNNYLVGVAATSSSNAWAVGSFSNGTASQTLIEHWNGAAWRVKTSPNPGGSANDNELGGVVATSSSNAWAVGSYSNGTARQTLIEHWNGTAWKHVSSPNPGGSGNDNWLSGVAVAASSNAWAVGSYWNGSAYVSLIEHWNGTAWRVKTSGNPSSSLNNLAQVAATSSSNAWAVGTYCNGTALQTLIEHWNGTAWRVQTSSNPGGSADDNYLAAVAATSASNAWAVGQYNNGTTYGTLIEHWNGTAWKHVTSP